MNRRPMAAYTILTGDDPEYGIYTDAYGLEMNIDDELAVDTVLFAPADSVCKITEETDVTSMGTVYAGVSDSIDSKTLKKLSGVSGCWSTEVRRPPRSSSWLPLVPPKCLS